MTVINFQKKKQMCIAHREVILGTNLTGNVLIEAKTCPGELKFIFVPGLYG